MTYTGSGAGLRLEAANFGGGSIKVSGTSQEINYFLTDHLGSTRVIVDGSGVVKERNDYYAFGAKHLRSDYPQTTNRYDFNGKEDQTTGSLNLLDYGARMYDPALGRWFNVDLLAEDYFNLSPFNYCTNNPIAFIDPNGMFATKFGAWWYNLWHGGNGIGRDSAGEWFAFSFVDGYVDGDGAINLIYDKTFDRGGRSEGQDWVSDFTGMQVFEPVSGFWANAGYDLLEIGAEFHDGKRNWDVDKQGVITGQNILVTGVVATPIIRGFNAIKAINGIKSVNSFKGAKSVGAAAKGFSKILQTGGQSLTDKTLKALRLTKKQGRDAIHALKKDYRLPNNFHGKIMGNGDYVNPQTGKIIDNLYNYVH